MKKIYIIKVFPASEMYPNEELENVEPYIIKTFVYNGSLGNALWAVSNSMGCYANAFEMEESKFKSLVNTLNDKMNDSDFGAYLQKNFI